MSNKINPYDLPNKAVHVVLQNIEWETTSAAKDLLPQTMTIPVNAESYNYQEEIVSKAMDIASSAQGFSILDCDVEPIDL